MPALRSVLLRHLLRVHHSPLHEGREECHGRGKRQVPHWAERDCRFVILYKISHPSHPMEIEKQSHGFDLDFVHS